MCDGTTKAPPLDGIFGPVMIFVGSLRVLDRVVFGAPPKGDWSASMGGVHVQMSVRHELEDAHLVRDGDMEREESAFDHQEDREGWRF